MTKLPKLHGVTSRYCYSTCKEKGGKHDKYDKEEKEENEEGTRLRKKVRRLEADLGYSNLAIDVSPHSSYQRTHQSWHTDDDDNQILRKHRKRRLPGILPSVNFEASASSKVADTSSSWILPAAPQQLRWRPIPWTRSTHSPRQHPDVSSGSLLANNYDSSKGSLGESNTQEHATRTLPWKWAIAAEAQKAGIFR